MDGIGTAKTPLVVWRQSGLLALDGAVGPSPRFWTVYRVTYPSRHAPSLVVRPCGVPLGGRPLWMPRGGWVVVVDAPQTAPGAPGSMPSVWASHGVGALDRRR